MIMGKKKKKKTNWKEVWIAVGIVLLILFVIGTWMENIELREKLIEYEKWGNEAEELFEEYNELRNKGLVIECDEGNEAMCFPDNVEVGYCEEGYEIKCHKK